MKSPVGLMVPLVDHHPGKSRNSTNVLSSYVVSGEGLQLVAGEGVVLSGVLCSVSALFNLHLICVLSLLKQLHALLIFSTYEILLSITYNFQFEVHTGLHSINIVCLQ